MILVYLLEWLESTIETVYISHIYTSLRIEVLERLEALKMNSVR